jgi:ubiquinone/menaquinone biosynthesis C-methylase UbiE
MPANFEDLTEATGIPVSREGAEMMYTRYAFATQVAQGKRVLELGCGAGQGFRMIGATAKSLVGGDYSLTLLRSAHRHYRGGFPLVRLSADRLPFSHSSFDLVILFEASYYVPDMTAAFREIARILGPRGVALFVNANPERPDFIRSPHSIQYHSADGFRAALGQAGFDTTVDAAFPVEARSKQGATRELASLVLSGVRRLLEALRLIPRTLRARARLKRLVYGKLLEVPPEISNGFAEAAPRTSVPPGPVRDYKVIYVTATKRPVPLR